MGAPPWSASRARTFQDCARKYYFRYHLAPAVRKPNPPPEAFLADRVKDLVGLEAWAGEIVHTLIDRVLNRWRAGRELSDEEVLNAAAQMLSRQFRDSREFWSADPEAFPRRPTLLDLHYYEGAALSRDRAASLKETVLESLRSFLHSELAWRIRNGGTSRWLPIERHAAARLEDGTLILVKPDFAFRDGDLLHIVDWKTGRPDPFWEMVQVTCYALFASQKWGQEMDRIVPQIVHLFPEFRRSPTEYNEESVREVQAFIRDSQEAIVSLIEEDALPPVDRFEFTPESQRCRWCQFRGMCDGAARCG
jgi:CRISPR/Cas system-associated exonuclease Cas4 (RecB family)